LPEDIRRLALSVAQAGDKHDAGSTCRAVCTVKFVHAVFVLYCFQQKSKRGVATPREGMDIINARLKIAYAFVKEYRK
jgi:phage-related protein